MGLAALPALGVTAGPPVESDDELELLLLLVVGFVAGVYLLYDGFDTWQMARLIQDTPTETVRSMAVGRTELKGVVRPRNETIDPPYVDEACVYVYWSAERRERHRDDDGNVHYSWETVADGTETVQFDFDDGTGQVCVRADVDDPEFEILSDEHSTTVTFGSGEAPDAQVLSYIRRYERQTDDPAEWAKPDEDDEGFLNEATDFVADLFDDQPLGDTAHRRRYEQEVLPVGVEGYIFGSAEPRADAELSTGQQDLLEIRRDSGTDEFLIADTSEKQLQDRYSSRGPLKTGAGLVLSPLALFLLLRWYGGAFGIAPLLGGLAALTLVVVAVLWWRDSSIWSLLRR